MSLGKPLKRGENIVSCIYGLSGVGKTRLIGETEAKTLIYRPPIEHTASIRSGNVTERVISSWKEMDEFEADARRYGSEYDWIWLDSLSGFQSVGLDDLWAEIVKENPRRARYGLDKGDYGVNMGRLIRHLRAMVGATGFNYGIITHPADVEGLRAPDEVILGPWVQGKNMPQQLVQMCHIVGYYHLNDDDKRVLATKLTDDYFAKDQFDAFGKSGKVVEPTMDELLAAINSSRGKPAAPKARRRATRRKAKSTRTKGA